MTLRAKLTLTVGLLTVVGLVLSGVAINATLHARLIAGVDEQLTDAAPVIANRFRAAMQSRGAAATATGQVARTTGPARAAAAADLPAALNNAAAARRPPFPQGTYAALYTQNGRRLREIEFRFDESVVSSPPSIDTRMITSAAAAGELTTTVPDQDGNGSYRVLLSREGRFVTATAIPLTDVTDTIALLTRIELVVAAIILVILVGVTFLIVRAEMRPLNRVTQTAEAIAGGDLAQRAPVSNASSEVGRLATAFNVMLARIDDAIAVRRRSQDQLREFIADASHELRTPLTSIRGYAEMFGRADLEQSELELIMRRIDQESTRMAGLVDDLLLLARLDEEATPELTQIDVAQLVRDAAADAAAADPDREITVSASAELVVTGDEHRLRAALSNLWRNALVHTPAGSPVEFAAAALDERAVVTVVDHGPGIPPEQRAHAFARLWRADESRVRDSGGSGLGLAITARIVEQLDGEVGVTDTAGGGATFFINLPLASVGKH